MSKPYITSVKAYACVCQRCGYTWIPSKTNGLPKRCASCRRPDWFKHANQIKKYKPRAVKEEAYGLQAETT